MQAIRSLNPPCRFASRQVEFMRPKPMSRHTFRIFQAPQQRWSGNLGSYVHGDSMGSPNGTGLSLWYSKTSPTRPANCLGRPRLSESFRCAHLPNQLFCALLPVFPTASCKRKNTCPQTQIAAIRHWKCHVSAQGWSSIKIVAPMDPLIFCLFWYWTIHWWGVRSYHVLVFLGIFFLLLGLLSGGVFVLVFPQGLNPPSHVTAVLVWSTDSCNYWVGPANASENHLPKSTICYNIRVDEWVDLIILINKTVICYEVNHGKPIHQPTIRRWCLPPSPKWWWPGNGANGIGFIVTVVCYRKLKNIINKLYNII